jgi:hypothetical protein
MLWFRIPIDNVQADSLAFADITNMTVDDVLRQEYAAQRIFGEQDREYLSCDLLKQVFRHILYIYKAFNTCLFIFQVGYLLIVSHFLTSFLQ